jgi:hypothetical protein
MRKIRITVGLFTIVLSMAGALRAQLAQEFKPAKANCCLPSQAQSLTDQLQDWNQLGRYNDDNARLSALPRDPNRVVFFGDSITDGWKLGQYFPDKPYVNRGIGGPNWLRNTASRLFSVP